jgi:hypothetical protein
MSPPKRTAPPAISKRIPRLAFHQLVRCGLNPYLLCGAVCSVEEAWKLVPGNQRQALKKKRFSIKGVAKLPGRLSEDACLLRRLNREGFFTLPDSSHVSLWRLLESAAIQLRNNFKAYPRQSWQNIYAAALVVLLREVESASEWGGQPTRRNVEPSLDEPSQKRVPAVPAYRLASELMRQGIPNDVLAAMHADFADATGRVPRFPSAEALRGRCRHLKKRSALWNEAKRLSETWISQYNYSPGTWNDAKAATGPVPPLAMLPKTSR